MRPDEYLREAAARIAEADRQAKEAAAAFAADPEAFVRLVEWRAEEARQRMERIASDARAESTAGTSGSPASAGNSEQSGDGRSGTGSGGESGGVGGPQEDARGEPPTNPRGPRRDDAGGRLRSGNSAN